MLLHTHYMRGVSLMGGLDDSRPSTGISVVFKFRRGRLTRAALARGLPGRVATQAGRRRAGRPVLSGRNM